MQCPILHFSKGLDERLSMTATAKQHWLEAVKIAAKSFLAAHKLPPAQQTITQFFSTSQASSRGTVEQISSPHALEAREHANLAQTNTHTWSTSIIDSTDMPPLIT
eukprot:3593657-Ditylum_brightwellii.AAC.1